MFGGVYLRVFAGIPLPEKIKHEIGFWMCENRKDYPDLKFVNLKLLHITVFFFGELPVDKVEELKNTVRLFKASKVKASLGGISFFPGFRKPNVFYINMKEGSENVLEIYKQFILNINQLGYNSKGKKFIPHITFARRRTRKTDLLNKKEDWSYFKNYNFNLKDIILERVVLYESKLKPDGPEYYPLTEILLDKTSADWK